MFITHIDQYYAMADKNSFFLLLRAISIEQYSRNVFISAFLLLELFVITYKSNCAVVISVWSVGVRRVLFCYQC